MTRKLTVTATKALAASRALGLTYWSPAPEVAPRALVSTARLACDWAVDDSHRFHAVARRNPRTGTPAARHACGLMRERLTAGLDTASTRARFALVLGLASPAWDCTADGEWIDCPDIDAALAAVWIEGRVA